jgi:hypothetical protein
MACGGTRRAAGADGAEVADTTPRGPARRPAGPRNGREHIPPSPPRASRPWRFCFAARLLLYHNGYRDLSEGTSPLVCAGRFLLGHAAPAGSVGRRNKNDHPRELCGARWISRVLLFRGSIGGLSQLAHTIAADLEAQMVPTDTVGTPHDLTSHCRARLIGRDRSLHDQAAAPVHAGAVLFMSAKATSLVRHVEALACA